MMFPRGIYHEGGIVFVGYSTLWQDLLFPLQQRLSGDWMHRTVWIYRTGKNIVLSKGTYHGGGIYVHGKKHLFGMTFHFVCSPMLWCVCSIFMVGATGFEPATP
ncbi:MAG: hypothetical protein ACP5UA_09870 [Candidatus Hydrogenedens sp.]